MREGLLRSVIAVIAAGFNGCSSMSTDRTFAQGVWRGRDPRITYRKGFYYLLCGSRSLVNLKKPYLQIQVTESTMLAFVKSFALFYIRFAQYYLYGWQRISYILTGVESRRIKFLKRPLKVFLSNGCLTLIGAMSN